MLHERHRFMKGLLAWVGYRQVFVPYERDKRFAGATKWNYWRLWNFSLEGIISFSIDPLKVATYIGLFTAVAAVLYGSYIAGRTVLFGNPVPRISTASRLYLVPWRCSARIIGYNR
jgi:hypothetical protein